MKNLTSMQTAPSRKPSAKREYAVTFRCYYEQSKYTRYIRTLQLKNLQRWIKSYQFTHPNCTSISFGVWLQDEPSMENPARSTESAPELPCELS